VIDADLIPESAALAHWDWTFIALGKVLRLRRACVSLIVVHRKTLPSPSNAWFSKLSADLAALHESVIVALPGPVLKVGPSSLSIISDLLGSAL
jgi:hypothetical protein